MSDTCLYCGQMPHTTKTSPLTMSLALLLLIPGCPGGDAADHVMQPDGKMVVVGQWGSSNIDATMLVERYVLE